MVGIMAKISRNKIASRIKSVKCGDESDIAWKLEKLRRLRNELSAADSSLLLESLSSILDLLSDRLSPIRKFTTQMIGEIGLKHFELLPEIIPAIIEILKDDTPAVARQAIACVVDIFRSSLIKVAIEGLYSSDSSESLKLLWTCMRTLKDEIYSMAFKVGSDGRRLPALKFVESVVLLYTSDPNGSLEPPGDQITEGIFEEFNVSWIRGGHPILNVGDLSVEASRSLGLLLDQLRFPSLKSHSNLMIIVLIKSLSAIATKRPAFYGRILPVLLGLDPSSSTMRGMHLTGVHHALKNAFESCLNCSHPGAAPWGDRLVNALNEIRVGKPTEQAGEETDKTNGTAGWKDDLHVAQSHEDDKHAAVLVSESGSAGRKRSGARDLTEDETPPKRERLTSQSSEGSGHGVSGKQDGTTSSGTTTRLDADNGPVQALITLFGSLVAQGEKAVVSLEILISSISADLLAEVVMANMRNLPPNRPKSEDDEELNVVAKHGLVGSNTHLKNLHSLLRDVLLQSKSSLGEETGAEHLQHSAPSEIEQTFKEEELQATLLDSDVADAGLSNVSEHGREAVSEPDSVDAIPSVVETGCAIATSVVIETEVVVDEIPGLTLLSPSDVLSENMTVLSNISIDLESTSQEQFTNLSQAPLEFAQSLSTDKSDELSPRATLTDATSINSSAATSVEPQLILPKISAPVISLADEQKDQLQELAYGRIVDTYQQVKAAGGSEVRFSVLAHSGLEFPSDLDPWKLLTTHILSDYLNHEGHELTLRVLYRLFREAEEDHDLFSSTTATSVYEKFLIQVAETLRDSFPASDKSLSRLLGEVPYLPKSIFEMLEHLCSPGSRDNDEKELHGGDRVTQGLSTVWSLILLRPPIQDACLKIALKSASHHLEEVRMKAIRLVANKLYPLSSISKKIEEFAKELLLSVARDDQIALAKEGAGTHTELEKDERQPSEDQSLRPITGDISTDTHQLSAPDSVPSSTVAEVQRCMSLYFALCTKKHSLLRQIFDIYQGASNDAKQAVHRQIPLLVRTIGSSRDLLDIISDPPSGSEGLVIQVVQTLTDGTVPSPDLIYTIKRLFDTKLKVVDILIPILPFLPKDEVLLRFPHLVNSPLDKFQVALSRVVEGSNNSAAVLTPAEALIAIHGIDPDRDGIPLKKVTDACNACFELRQIFSQQVLAKVLNQLVEQIPLPMLFMRTVLQAIGAFPSLVEFIMEILSRLVSKQIWKYPRLWVGFMKCTLLTKPHSFGVLLQLPPAQLENVVNKTPALKAPLIAHASQPHIRSSLPRSTLLVLGIASEPQTCTQAPTQTQTVAISESQTSIQTQPPQTQTGETGVSATEAAADKPKESSSAAS